MSVISCCLSVSLTLKGMHLPFLRQFSHGIIILAVSLSFLNMLKFCCFHWERCKRQRHSTKKNLLCHIFTMGALWSIIQADLRKQSEGLQLFFFFFYFYKLVMWPTTQQPMAWTLTHRIIMILYFLTSWSCISFWFSGYNVLVTIFGNVHRPCIHHFIIVRNSL